MLVHVLDTGPRRMRGTEPKHGTVLDTTQSLELSLPQVNPSWCMSEKYILYVFCS